MRKVFRQKQCLPAYRHHSILFESASCKNSETSCLGLKHKFEFDRVPVKFLRNSHGCISALFKCPCAATSQYHRDNQLAQDIKFEQWQLTQHAKFRCFICLCPYARTSRDRGWRKKKIARQQLDIGLCYARGNNQQGAVQECCNLYRIVHHGVRASSAVGRQSTTTRLTDFSCSFFNSPSFDNVLLRINPYTEN